MNDLAIGVDLGGTQVRAALVDAGGVVLKRAALPTAAQSGPQAVVDQIGELVEDVARGLDAQKRIGVGLSSPGPLDADAGVALGIPTLRGFDGAPLRDLVAARVGRRVTLENDGISAALGEWRFGAGRGFKHLVYITVSTGIGGGVVSDGRVVRGRRGMAGHIGHMSLVRDGAGCACGARGCWEAYASGPAFARRARARLAAEGRVTRLDAGALDAPAIFAAAEGGDRFARDLVEEQADWLGRGIVNLLHLFSPELVLLGGGVANGFASLEPFIRARIARDAMPAFRDVQIRRAALGENSGLVGAAVLAFDAAAAGGAEHA